jgi:hypothetical protein
MYLPRYILKTKSIPRIRKRDGLNLLAEMLIFMFIYKNEKASKAMFYFKALKLLNVLNI